MKFIDLHCDTLMMAYAQRKTDIREMPGMLDITRMKSAGALAQFFAIFMLPPGSEKHLGRTEPIDDQEYVDTSLATFYNTMEVCKDVIAPAFNYNDIITNEKNGKMSGLLTFEDGRIIDGKLENLKHYHSKGIRLISLTWNFENCFGAPNSKDPEIMAKGLTDFGKEAILYMNDLGMLVDVSHLSDGGFYDVARYAKKPFVASHSNSRSMCGHTRNLTDDMLRVMGDTGSVAGLNFGPDFIHPLMTKGNSDVWGMSRQIRHMINLGGEDVVALGSDFDGIGGDIEVSSVDKMGLLFDRLKKDGLSEATIEKIAYKNALRVIKDTLI